MSTKINWFLSFFAYYFFKVYLHHFSKIKSHKKSHKTVEINVFLLFLLMIEGSGAGSIFLTNGSGCGSGRTKNIWILRTATLQQKLMFCVIRICWGRPRTRCCPPAEWARRLVRGPGRRCSMGARPSTRPLPAQPRLHPPRPCPRHRPTILFLSFRYSTCSTFSLYCIWRNVYS